MQMKWGCISGDVRALKPDVFTHMDRCGEVEDKHRSSHCVSWEDAEQGGVL